MVHQNQEYFHVAAVGFEPVISFLLLVIRGVVLDQVDAVAAPVKGGNHHLVQEGQIGLPLKVILLMKVDEIGVVQTHGSKDFLCMALAARGIWGWLPRLAQVACSVGVWRNEASALAFFRFG